jgi:hypothetical protein
LGKCHGKDSFWPCSKFGRWGVARPGIRIIADNSREEVLTLQGPRNRVLVVLGELCPNLQGENNPKISYL